MQHTDEIDTALQRRRPYKRWMRNNVHRIKGSLISAPEITQMTSEDLAILMKQFQVTFEERDQILRPLAEGGQEAVGSMGDDTPVAVLSKKNRPLYDYFRQQFAQVTNPPIDPLRETTVMSLETCFGSEVNIFAESEDTAYRTILNSPVLSTRKFFTLLSEESQKNLPLEELHLGYDPKTTDLKTALVRLCDRAEQSVRKGTVIVLLTDRHIKQDQLPIYALLATGAVHHRSGRNRFALQIQYSGTNRWRTRSAPICLLTWLRCYRYSSLISAIAYCVAWLIVVN